MLDDHVTVFVVAFDGDTVAVRVVSSPTFIFAVDLLRVTPVTAIVVTFSLYAPDVLPGAALPFGNIFICIDSSL